MYGYFPGQDFKRVSTIVLLAMRENIKLFEEVVLRAKTLAILR